MSAELWVTIQQYSVLGVRCSVFGIRYSVFGEHKQKINPNSTLTALNRSISFFAKPLNGKTPKPFS